MVSVSDSGETSIRVSWGPLRPEVTGYQIEYSALPRGKVQIATVDRRHNSTLLKGLQPDTTYLVTVVAQYPAGKEKALSVKACTQEGELLKEPELFFFPTSCPLILQRLGPSGFYVSVNNLYFHSG